MVFWRNRNAKETETASPQPKKSGAAKSGTATGDDSASEAGNVVALAKNRLADRLAGVASSPGDLGAIEASVRAESNEPAPIKPSDQPHFFGQKRAVARIRAALSSKPGEHIVILGDAGTGRTAVAEALASEAKGRPAHDWIYVAERQAPSRLRAYAVPPGKGARLRREISAAIERASAAFERHLKSDEHRISVDLLEEEARHRSESAVEEVRRRAEAQNIAVVKSLDGYVLAPMHDGRVVRSDVFRALPEALKRNVEAKITTLEDELQSIVATMPDLEFEAGEKYDALIRQTALRAIRPSLAPLKQAYAKDASAASALDAIEDSFVASAVTGTGSGAFAPVAILHSGSDDAGETSEPRNVVTARRASPSDLLGEIGRDARGRLALIPGDLMRAGSGYLIIEAWRLAADPKAWQALSAAIARKEIRPLIGPGLAMEPDPVPLTATIILIADDQSWSKLDAIEPGIARHFPHVAKLAATAALADIGEEDYARGAAWLAAEYDLRPLSPAVAPIIYKDAIRRGSGRVSLASIALLHLLQEADAVAGADAASRIRPADINRALTRRADGEAP